ncbi:MAG TPA: HlyC/CorC family transporter [Candidatus Scatavimonas merdigallinarum]|uniref:HlyC/CorC family transporter n=1 Tax=Candidatus Scatavimonas merdigallinarum TaxID=2840914 RepID=A0A9D1CUY7_9FIRM|nr:HlyC/CorC family transporter [Candidatus Scatavimonas merdigallinarum]
MSVAILILIILSAFFSSVETAFSTVNTIRLKHDAQNGSKKAKDALYITENYDKALTTVLIGNNIVNISCSSIATVLCINLFGDMGAAISTGAVTLLVLTFGEIMPKCIAKERADSYCLFTAKALRILMTVFTPIVFIFIKMKSAALKRMHKNEKTPSVTEDELKYIIESIEEEGVLEQQERELVQSALDFDEKTVQEVLTPRVDITAIEVNDDVRDIAKLILSERYSRIPVYKDTLDNVIGILHTRDFLEAIVNGETPNIQELIQPAYFIYKTKKLSKVLTDFKHKKLNIAIVSDEYGGTVGIVTMEDLLEEIVGEIWDEDEEIEHMYKELSDGSYEISGDMDIDEMLELFALDPKTIQSESVSVGGWVLEMLGSIPNEGDSFQFDSLFITVAEVSEQRITRLIMKKSAEQERTETKD